MKESKIYDIKPEYKTDCDFGFEPVSNNEILMKTLEALTAKDIKQHNEPELFSDEELDTVLGEISDKEYSEMLSNYQKQKSDMRNAKLNSQGFSNNPHNKPSNKGPRGFSV